MDDINKYIEEIWYSSINEADRKRFDKNKAWQRFLKRTGKAGEQPAAYRKSSLRIVWRAAAAVAALFIASYVAFQQGSKQQRGSEPVAEFADINIEASWGSLAMTTLPDGTTVWLNANSKLTYSQGFGINNRNVYLCGEGYFEVARNENLPFSVNTDELKVSVLGTKFNFRNYPDDKEATVCLIEGKILIGNLIIQEDEIVMTPNEKLFFDKNSGQMLLKTVTAANTMAWTSGFLFFDEDLLSDIAKDLERSYNVTIEVHPDVANMRFYGRFVRKEQSVSDILNMFASIGKIEYRMTGNKIKINPK